MKETYFIEEFIEWLKTDSRFSTLWPDVIGYKSGNTDNLAIHENVSDVVIFDDDGTKVENKDKIAIAINCNVGIPDYEVGDGEIFENYAMEFTIVGRNNHKIIKKQTRLIKRIFRKFNGDMLTEIKVKDIQELKDTLKPEELALATNSTVIKSRLNEQLYNKTDDGEYEYSVSLLNFYNKTT